MWQSRTCLLRSVQMSLGSELTALERI
jgi:hypothetical protein